MNLPCPRGRAGAAAVERREPVEVRDEIRTDRREDVDAGRDLRVHLAVHQRGMEVPGVERHEANVSHKAVIGNV